MAAQNQVPSKKHSANHADHQADNWFVAPLEASQQTAEWLNQFQRTIMQAATTWNETLVKGLADLSHAKNLLQAFSAESNVMGQLLDTLASQQTGLMQFIFDSQLNLFDKMFMETSQPEPAPLKAEYGRDLLSSWGKTQDEWIKMSKEVIDTASALQTGK